MTPIKRACCFFASLNNVADLFVVGGSLGIHGQTKRVSCLRPICTDLIPFHLTILSPSVPPHNIVHLFDVFSWPSSFHYPARICRIAFSCLLYPTRTPFPTPIRPLQFVYPYIVIGTRYHVIPFS